MVDCARNHSLFVTMTRGKSPPEEFKPRKTTPEQITFKSSTYAAKQFSTFTYFSVLTMRRLNRLLNSLYSLVFSKE